jgi:hypothetical protein
MQSRAMHSLAPHRSRGEPAFPLRGAAAVVVLSMCMLLTQALSAQHARPADVVDLRPPELALGQAVGADRFLATYTQLAAYWRELAERSDRMQLERIGTTGYGQPMWLAVISSPDNLARIDEIRADVEAFARGRVDESEVLARAETCPTVVWIDAGMHATEAVAGQNILELVWRMVASEEAEVRRILDDVVLLVCPANPDGMELVASAYAATGVVGRLPILYQRYCGHDNNRDFYACNTAEARAISLQLYERWYPQIVYNHHQTAPRGTILFTPPFRDPFNYQFDPLVVRGIELVSAHMNHRFAAEGKPGIISRSGATYSTWWNGGLRTTAYFHNQIGILTEAFGHPDPTEIVQGDDRRLPSVDHPDPLPSGVWHPRQTIEYLQTANFAILDLASRYRAELLQGQWRMARRSIERGSRDHWTPTPHLLDLATSRAAARKAGEEAGESVEHIRSPWSDPALRDPRVYVLPSNAPNFADATRFVRRLRRSGIEVEELLVEAENPDGGRRLPAGSYVVRAAQAFRPHVRDMFEPQWYPDDRDAGSGEPVRPYDSAGWTLALQMGVDVIRIVSSDLEATTRPIEDVEVPFRPGDVRGAPDAAYFLLDAADANLHLAANELLGSGERLLRTDEPFFAGDEAWSRGTLVVVSGDETAARLADLAERTGCRFVGVSSLPVAAALELRPRRVGLFDVYGGDMPTGWALFALEQYGFDVVRVFGERIENDERPLREDFDVLVFHTGLPPAPSERTREALRRGGRSEATVDQLAALASVLPPFEDWSDLADRRTAITPERGMQRLRRFVEDGGVVLLLGGESTDFVAHALDEGVIEIGLTVEGRRPQADEFFVPGSLLWTEVDADSPLGFGLPPRIATMMRNRGVVLEAVGDRTQHGLTVAARYPPADSLLASGWAIGEDLLVGKHAVVSGRIGSGSYHLFGADVLYRGQPTQSFRLVFNAIQLGAARRAPVTAD